MYVLLDLPLLIHIDILNNKEHYLLILNKTKIQS